jgi:hypothetical protein
MILVLGPNTNEKLSGKDFRNQAYPWMVYRFSKKNCLQIPLREE